MAAAAAPQDPAIKQEDLAQGLLDCMTIPTDSLARKLASIAEMQAQLIELLRAQNAELAAPLPDGIPDTFSKVAQYQQKAVLLGRDIGALNERCSKAKAKLAKLRQRRTQVLADNAEKERRNAEREHKIRAEVVEAPAAL
eukprot:TRINITY_DN5962_c0_g1_i2.p2 TRINITY_DN5962_c0_g1~~TRINITY_DN5962_c0_g1_i2.p2  ORF type:complete len:148 (-),score=51.76 TRINITY_DN5962_c0_g1_i2:365-784(-)